MKYKNTPIVGEYVEVEYHQFNQSLFFKFLWNFFTFVFIPFLLPFILASKTSDFIFKACSEFLSLFPSIFGIILRYVFYKFTLSSCGKNVFIDFGTIFYYPKISIGSNVTFGIGNIVQHCDFGDNVLISDGCRFIGGVKKHNFDRTDIPIVYQGGKIKRIKIGSDTWIGPNAIIMESIGEGCVIGAGSVVTKEVEPYSICAGNPATVIRKRK